MNADIDEEILSHIRLHAEDLERSGIDSSFNSVFKDSTADPTPSNSVATPLAYNVSPDYLDAAEAELIAGRSFTWNDDAKAARVVFGSEAAAMGRYFKIFGGKRWQVVGIVQDGKYRGNFRRPATGRVLAGSAVTDERDVAGRPLPSGPSAIGASSPGNAVKSG